MYDLVKLGYLRNGSHHRSAGCGACATADFFTFGPYPGDIPQVAEGQDHSVTTAADGVPEVFTRVMRSVLRLRVDEVPSTS